MITSWRNQNAEVTDSQFNLYHYDQLNRIFDMFTYKARSTDQQMNYQPSYQANYSYDANGNLQTLNRWAHRRSDPNDQSSDIVVDQMDALNYTYNNPLNNRLTHVDDDIPNGVFGNDLDDQDPDNYVYDAIGQLREDVKEGLKISWRVDGKVAGIEKADGTNITFVYDGLGNRVLKRNTSSGELGSNIATHYSRDAQGNVMAVYEHGISKGKIKLFTNLPRELVDQLGGIEQNIYSLKEHHIYGSSRLGMQTYDYYLQPNNPHRYVGDKRYELSNHLGNVLGVVTDRKPVNSKTKIRFQPIGEDLYTTWETPSLFRLVNKTENPHPVVYGLLDKDQLQNMYNAYQSAKTDYDSGKADLDNKLANGDIDAARYQQDLQVLQATLNNQKTEPFVALKTQIALNPEKSDNNILYAEVSKSPDFPAQGKAFWVLRNKNDYTELARFEIPATGIVSEQLPTLPSDTYSLQLELALPRDINKTELDQAKPISLDYNDLVVFAFDTMPDDFSALYLPEVVSYTDYFPFGSEVPDPSKTGGNERFRYGFQNQERDDEIKGEGNSLNYTFRMHDPRVGRFFAADPLESEFPWNSPYVFSENRVIASVELEGCEAQDLNTEQNGGVGPQQPIGTVYGPYKSDSDSLNSGHMNQQGGMHESLNEVVVPYSKGNISTINSPVSYVDFRKEIMPVIFKNEGGYQNLKGDKGNYVKIGTRRILIGTNHGISAPVLMEHLGKLPTVEEMRSLTKEDAAEIYQQRFWNRPKMNEIRDRSNVLQYCDMYVNGEKSSVRIMKRALNSFGYNFKINGKVNSKYIEAINSVNQESLHEKFKSERKLFYRKLAKDNPEQYQQFLSEWLNRAERFNYSKK
ncbi:MAG: hypothetical protein CFE24_13515 [Flavobacterium sp. BFFFF2]|nr:MAG: hypothetical protein CFE24_13515 [Flavobacterium sp. BFFFF2]